MADNPEENEASAEQEAPEAATTPAPDRKSGMLVMIIIGFMVMILTPLITVVAVKITARDGPPTPRQKSQEASGVFSVDPVVVNIDNTHGSRYLRVGAHLVVSPPRLTEGLREHMPLLKDRIMSAVGNKSLAELEGEKGREMLRRDIKDRVNAVLMDAMKGAVVDVYFSEYLIQ